MTNIFLICNEITYELDRLLSIVYRLLSLALHPCVNHLLSWAELSFDAQSVIFTRLADQMLGSVHSCNRTGL